MHKQHDLQPGKEKKVSQLAVMLATPSHAIESVEDENQNKARVWGKSETGRSQSVSKQFEGNYRQSPDTKQ